MGMIAQPLGQQLHQFITAQNQIPLSIYQRSLQVLPTWLLPCALVSYYPSLVRLGKDAAQWWLGWSALLAALGMALLTAWFWRQAVTHYQRVGY